MINTQIDKKENNIICTIIALPYDHTSCGERVYMSTKRVKKLLIKNGHQPGITVIESRVDNCNGELKGVWVFEDDSVEIAPPITLEENTTEDVLVEESPKKTTSKSKGTGRRKNSRKSKKSLDNLSKDVIIEE